MSANFVIAVTSSLTTAGILWILRIIVKARTAVTRIIIEHDFLMESMRVVLAKLQIDFKEPNSKRQ